jgi:hypothetical protein
MKIDSYTKIVLTGILGCLSWLCATLTPIATPVEAQVGPTQVVLAGYQEGSQVVPFSAARGLPVVLVTAGTTAQPLVGNVAPPTATTPSRPAVAPSSTQPAPIQSARQQCAAITQKGTRCSRMASAGSAYCWQHAR